MAKSHLARVAVVLLCWEFLATARVTKHAVLQYKHPAEANLDETRDLPMATPPDTVGFVKYTTLHDYDVKMIAYKDLEKSQCYLERMKDSDSGLKHTLTEIQSQSQSSKMRDETRTMYVPDNSLSKYEVWRLAGPRISEFCRGFLTWLLQELRPHFRSGIMNNALPDQPALWLSHLQYGDALLQRVKGRAKRQTTYTTRGYGRRHRGQTQTQYLAFQNGGNAGKAEAESSPDLSRTHVSGTNGMGQAQSQTGEGNGCEGCFPGGVRPYGTPQVVVPGAGVGLPGVGIPGEGAPEVPGIGALGVGPPEVGVPGVGTPGIGVPVVGAPGVQVPGVRAPGVLGVPAHGVGVPGVGAPGVGVPGVGAPGVGVPGVGIPGLGVPGPPVTGIYQQPTGVPGVGILPQLGIYHPGVTDVGVPGVPGAGIPGVIPSVGVPGVAPGVGIPGGVPAGVPGVAPGIAVPGGVPGIGVPGVAPGVGVPVVPGVSVPGVAPGVGVPGVGVPGVAPGVGVPGWVPGVGVPGLTPGVGVPVVPGVSVPGVAPGVGVPVAPGFGVPGGVPAGVPGVAPGIGVPGGVPGVTVPGVAPGVGVPGGVPGFGVPGVAPGVGVPGGVPGVSVPGVAPLVGVPGGVPGVGVPGGVPGVGVPGVAPGVGVPVVPGVSVPGVAPGVGVPGAVPGAGVPWGIPGFGVPGGVPAVGVPAAIPGTGLPWGFPGRIPGAGVPAEVPGVGVPGGTPSAGIPGVGVPGGVPSVGMPGIVPGVAPPGAIPYQPGIYQPSGTGIQVGYPGGIVTQPQYVQPGRVNGVYTGQEVYYAAAGDSQVESTVRQEDKETRAASSAQAKYGEGTAQTQVSGIYSGTGAFSAQAQTSDKDRGAQSQVVGGKEGATSTAQGQAGSGKTQSQVQLGSSSGATAAEAQSGGLYYGTNTQVQAGHQGGMADAQAKGQGSTSSQAQIGFTPYQKNDRTNGLNSPFRGGGSASAQSGAYSGQSQSQIQGSFLHGISYTGAAQAGSGQTNYSRIANSNYENFGGKLGLVQSGSRDSISQNGVSTSHAQQPGYQPFGSSNNPPSSHTITQQQTRERGRSGQEDAALPHSDQLRRYDDETIRQPRPFTGTETGSQHEESSNLGVIRNGNGRVQGGYRIQTHVNRNDTGHTGVPTQTQHIVLGPLNGHGAHIVQDSDDQDQYSPGDILQPGQTIHGTPEYTIPKGYRGRITSVAGPQKTSVQGGQSQTVVVTPGVGNVTYTNPSAGRYQPPVMSIPVSQQAAEGGYEQKSQSGHVGSENTQLRNGGQPSFPLRRNGSQFNQRSGRTSRNGNHIRNGHSLNTHHQPTPDSFVTVTKSVTGQLDNGKANNSTGKYTHTYYTKSSTCGYFTFSCNIVFGSNGRTKICKPNPQTKPDGTPCCC